MVTLQLLVDSYGVDAEVAAAIEQRSPPTGNMHWRADSSYLQPSFRYLVIPLALTIIKQASRKCFEYNLLVDRIERILHVGALEENGYLTVEAAISQARFAAGCPCENRVAAYVRERSLRSDGQRLSERFRNLHAMNPIYTATSLRRADPLFFLFWDHPDSNFRTLALQFTALLNVILLLDDFADFTEDQLLGVDNYFLDWRTNSQRLTSPSELLKNSIEVLSIFNKSFCDTLASGIKINQFSL